MHAHEEDSTEAIKINNFYFVLLMICITFARDMPLSWHKTTLQKNLINKNMYKIQANASGTRSINVSDENLQTIKKYSLLKNLIDSTGFIDEAVLEKLRLNMRAMLESNKGADKGLIDLCLDVIYNKNMKALGLHQLILLYIEWDEKNNTEEIED